MIPVYLCFIYTHDTSICEVSNKNGANILDIKLKPSHVNTKKLMGRSFLRVKIIPNYVVSVEVRTTIFYSARFISVNFFLHNL